jgi:hypothetical protein
VLTWPGGCRFHGPGPGPCHPLLSSSSLFVVFLLCVSLLSSTSLLSLLPPSFPVGQYAPASHPMSGCLWRWWLVPFPVMGVDGTVVFPCCPRHLGPLGLVGGLRVVVVAYLAGITLHGPPNTSPPSLSSFLKASHPVWMGRRGLWRWGCVVDENHVIT